jgi:hypothetical protein
MVCASAVVAAAWEACCWWEIFPLREEVFSSLASAGVVL